MFTQARAEGTGAAEWQVGGMTWELTQEGEARGRLLCRVQGIRTLPSFSFQAHCLQNYEQHLPLFTQIVHVSAVLSEGMRFP